MNTSELVLKYLIEDAEYVKRVLPFLEEEYFESKSEQKLFQHIRTYVGRYNVPPTIEAIYIELSNDHTISEQISEEIDQKITTLKEDIKKPTLNWLIDTTENFCKDRALYNAIYQSISIVEGTNQKLGKGAIPSILQNALAVSFDTTVGHDFFDDAERRFEYYHKVEEKIPLNLEYLHKVTGGGFSRKTLNLFLSGTHGGKSAFMCHLAAGNLQEGKNVLYVSLEMAAEEISKRIDANLMDITLDDLILLPKQMYMDRINRLRLKTKGKLVVKEFPTSTAHVGHIRNLLNELLLKKEFIPDIIYVDYLNIMASYRIKPGTNSNSYTYNKSISEELRGLGAEMNVPIVSASQLNRTGFSNSNPEMDDIAESFGINFVADFVAALLANEDLIKQNLMLVKQLKSRYGDKNRIPMFFVGFDRPKMKFYDLDDPFAGLHTGQQEDKQDVQKIIGGNNKDKSRFGNFKT